MQNKIYIKLLRLFNGTRLSYRFHLRYWFHPDVDVAAAVLSTMRASRALRPELVDFPPGKKITVIAPHPDDEIIGPGGSLLKAKSIGARIDIVYLTNGEIDKEKGIKRIEEAEIVNALLGFDFQYLGLDVGDLKPDEHKNELLENAIRKADPDIIFVPFILDDNDDHRLSAVLLAETLKNGAFTKDIEIWSYQVYSSLPGNVIVPIDKFVDKKVDAINLYASQSAVRDWAHYSLGLNAYNTRLTPRAYVEKYVEVFFVIPAKEFIELCGKFCDENNRHL